MTQVIKGLLGYSNKRVGLEFYRYDEKIIPRHKSEWGELLVDNIDRNFEGCPVVIVIMDRESSVEEVLNMANGIASQVVEYD